ncbi:hypothetical protein HIM_12088 [Hirsutella minnesotensis 3608]|uniref:Uncharacterized protein n=1 Tax=Hirsutella minnesotensis 3608 TaxID=1043627 RepID=A0A0F7ZQV5_9HYPO|nr:hypothetical protein HIM_12088 [Hirsutella minnesotensis 3608]
MDVTSCSGDQILREVATWYDLDAADFTFHDDQESAVAVVIYITQDENGQPIHDGGEVFFKDGGDEGIRTGIYADEGKQGVWLFSVPEGGLYVDNARVVFVKLKKKPKKKGYK